MKRENNQNVFFVAGVTGKVGGATARRLLAQGHAVRTLTRDPQKAADWARQGVEVRQGDLGDPAALAGALASVAGAFLLMPPLLAPSPGYPEARSLAASYAAALRQSPPPRLAVLSSFGSEQSSGLGLITATAILEAALGDLPFPTAFVRGGGFIENALGGLGGAAATGMYHSFTQPTNRPVPTTATADLGAEITRLLADGWEGKKIVEVGSLLSPDDLARAMGEALGRPVQAQAIPRERWAETIQRFGVPLGATGPYEEMMDGINSGWIHFGVPGAESVAGTTPAAQVFAGTGSARPGH